MTEVSGLYHTILYYTILYYTILYSKLLTLIEIVYKGLSMLYVLGYAALMLRCLT